MICFTSFLYIYRFVLIFFISLWVRVVSLLQATFFCFKYIFVLIKSFVLDVLESVLNMLFPFFYVLAKLNKLFILDVSDRVLIHFWYVTCYVFFLYVSKYLLLKRTCQICVTTRLYVKRGRKNRKWEYVIRTCNGNFSLLGKICVLPRKSILNTGRGIFHLKVHWHCLIPPFKNWATQSTKRGMCLCLEILNTFFAGNLFWSCNMLFKLFVVLWKSIST